MKMDYPTICCLIFGLWNAHFGLHVLLLMSFFISVTLHFAVRYLRAELARPTAVKLCQMMEKRWSSFDLFFRVVSTDSSTIIEIWFCLRICVPKKAKFGFVHKFTSISLCKTLYLWLNFSVNENMSVLWSWRSCYKLLVSFKVFLLRFCMLGGLKPDRVQNSTRPGSLTLIGQIYAKYS